MTKVMTRARGRRPGAGTGPGAGARPPGRKDSRRPGGTPARGPVPPVPTQVHDVFAERLLAVLSGRLPVYCMLRHTVGRAYDELVWLAEREPLRTPGVSPVVLDIGYDLPRAGAVEAFARIGAGSRVRALAFRLERGRDRRWRCVAVEVGGDRMPREEDGEV